MPLYVRHCKQRFFPSVSKCFGKVYAHQKRAQKPRTVRHRHCVDIVFCHICLRKRVLDHGFDCKRMISACDFGNDASESTMYLDLRSHDIGDDLSSVTHDCARGFVATRLNRKHGQIVFILQIIHNYTRLEYRFFDYF